MPRTLRLRYLTLALLGLVLAPGARGEIPANTWVKLEPAPCDGALCSSPFPEKRGYSGTTIGGGYLWYWGGAHKTHPGNDIDAYDIGANKWVQLTRMEDWTKHPDWAHLTDAEKQALADAIGGGGSPGFLSPLGRLLTAHSYAKHGWDPVTDRYCTAKGGLWCYDPDKGDAAGERAQAATDPSQPDGAWAKVTPSYPGVGEHGCSFATELAWDPSRDTWALFTGCHSAGYLLENGRWVQRASGFPYRKFGELYAEYVPTWGDWLVLHKRVLMRVDLATGKVTRITPPPGEARLISVSLEWAPEIERVLFADGNQGFRNLLAYDPATDSWQQLFLDGAMPADASSRWDLLDRDPQTGRYFVPYVPDGGGKFLPGAVYTFRLTRNALGNKPRACPVDACMGDGHLHGSLQAALDAAPPGGVVGVADGKYAQCATITKPVTIRPLSGRPHFHDRICRGKGALVNKAEGTVTVEGLEISGITGEKAIWHHNGAGRLVLRDLVIHDSGMGVFGARAKSLELYNSRLYAMTDRNELAHFVYGAELERLVVEGNDLRSGSDGHFIKAASVDTVIRYNRIRNTRATDAALIDVWGCGTNRIVGNVLDSEHAGFGQAIKVHNRGDGTPGPPFAQCPVNNASVEVAYNSYRKRGGSNTAFVAESYNGPASGTGPLRVRLVNNAVAIPATGGKLFYDGADSSARFPDNQYGHDPEALFRDDGLHPADPRPAVAGRVPDRQYAHPVGTEARPDGAIMGAFGR